MAALGTFVALTACTSSNPTSSDGTVSTSSTSDRAVGSAARSSSATPSLRPVPSTAVPPSQRGNLTQTVPSRSVRTLEAVPLRSPVRIDRAIVASLSQVRRTTVTARIPGETSGPALSASLTLRNATGSAVSAGDVVVNVVDGGGRPLVPIATASRPVPGTVAARGLATGTYVFRLPTGFDNPVRVDVSYSATAPVALFVGNA